MKKKVRLPNYIVPERYKIILRPNLDNFVFTGDETIYLDVKKPVKKITLHSVDLDIEESRALVDDKSFETKKISIDSDLETITLEFDKSIKGKVELQLKFKGILSEKLKGFYKSKYTIDGVDKYLATTQFESTDARRAFPCIDEPSAKAIFDVTLIIPSHMVAISNTVESVVSEHEEGYKIIEFAPTPKMSTYLLAFIVGELEYIEDKTEDGVLVRVFTTPGKKQQGRFALEVAKKALTFYNRYFDIAYPLPILDLIAIPDFSAGAMENWGAVTYRETALLIDPETSAAANKQRVAIVVAHELAHMWFGDLVTMEWWTHLWLNEGFASYIEYLAVDHIFPEWDIWTQFIYDEQGVALRLDALDTTHPVEIEVHHPSEISEIFDKISYSKGSSIIRMLAEYIGADSFRDGLRHYLTKHQYSNARTEDLWESFEAVSGIKVAEIMSNWTSKSGYPLLTVKEKDSQLEVTQERFYSSQLSKRKNKDKTIWSIPLKIATPKSDSEYTLLDKKTQLLTLPDQEWFKLNDNEASFVRVNYPDKYWEELEIAVEKKSLSPADRLGLIRDTFDLAEAGELPTSEALDFVRAYRNETSYPVWLIVASGMSKIDNLLYSEKYHDKFTTFARDLFKEIADKMGWEKGLEETHVDHLLRSLALYSFGSFGDQDTISKAQELFAKSLSSDLKIDPDIRSVVYNLVAENGGETEYSQIQKLYIKSNNQQEKDRLAKALGSFSDSRQLQKTLEFALSGEVRAQDAIFFWVAVVSNNKGRDIAWDFIKNNWPELLKRYGGAHILLPRLIESLGSYTKKSTAMDIKKFFKENHSQDVERTYKQVIEKILSNADWLKRDGKKIEAFLDNI